MLWRRAVFGILQEASVFLLQKQEAPLFLKEKLLRKKQYHNNMILQRWRIISLWYRCFSCVFFFKDKPLFSQQQNVFWKISRLVPFKEMVPFQENTEAASFFFWWGSEEPFLNNRTEHGSFQKKPTSMNSSKRRTMVRSWRTALLFLSLSCFEERRNTICFKRAAAQKRTALLFLVCVFQKTAERTSERRKQKAAVLGILREASWTTPLLLVNKIQKKSWYWYGLISEAPYNDCFFSFSSKLSENYKLTTLLGASFFFWAKEATI